MWIHVPLECSPSSVECPDWALESESLYQNLAMYCSSRGNLLPAKYWRRAWPMDRLTRHPSLRILPSSTAILGVEAWISLKGARPARIYQSLVNEQVLEEAVAGSGTSTSGLLKKSSRKVSSSKTSADYSQVALFSTDPTYWDTSTQFAVPRKLRKSVGALKLTSNAFTGDFSKHTESRPCSMSSAAWERWVTKARLDFSRRQKSGPAINESAFSSSRIAPAAGSEISGETPSDVWRSPNTRDHHAGGRTSNTTTTRADGSKRQVDLGAIAPLWPTITTSDGGAETATQKQGRGSGGGNIQAAANLWQTPATDSFRSRGGDRQDEMGLDQEARHWGTPTTRDWKDGSSSEAGCPTNGLLGRQVIRSWPTPDAGLYGNQPNANTKEWGGNNTLISFAEKGFLSSPRAQATPDGPTSSENTPGSLLPSQRKRLNALFVTWMMGWPLFWLAPVPINLGLRGMESYLLAQRWHLSRLLGKSASNKGATQ